MSKFLDPYAQNDGVFGKGREDLFNSTLGETTFVADNADHNAAIVIRKRAMDLMLNSGTELVGTQKNVLRLRANHNRSKTVKSQDFAANDGLLKKKVA